MARRGLLCQARCRNTVHFPGYRIACVAELSMFQRRACCRLCGSMRIRNRTRHDQPEPEPLVEAHTDLVCFQAVVGGSTGRNDIGCQAFSL